MTSANANSNIIVADGSYWGTIDNISDYRRMATFSDIIYGIKDDYINCTTYRPTDSNTSVAWAISTISLLST